MKKAIFSIGLILFLSADLPVFSQKILYPETNNNDVRIDNFEIDNGHAGPSGTSIMQDRKGFIWCGTETGLFRFNGINYKKYPYGNDETSLLGNFLQSIFEDSRGDIWVGTFGALNRIDLRSGRISHFIPDTADFASPDNTIRLINENRNGLLWLITDRHIFTFDREKESFTRFVTDSLAWRQTIQPVVYEYERFLEDRSGRIWIATDNGLYLCDKGWRKIYPGVNDPANLEQCKINCVKEDGEGNIWCGTEIRGLIRITDAEKGLYEEIKLSGSGKNVSGKNTVTAIFTDASDCLWVFGNSVLCRYKPVEKGTADYLFSDERIPDPKWQNTLRIDRIFGDKDGTLWLVNLYRGLMFRFVPATEKLFLYFVPAWINFTCIRDNTGSFWFGANRNNMFRLFTGSLPFITRIIQNGGYAESIRKARITEDDRGNIWLALGGGIFRIDNPDYATGLMPVKIDISGVNAGARSVFNDSRGNLWFGTGGGVTVKYDPVSNKSQKFSLPVDLTLPYSGSVSIITEDRSGTIWLATMTEGIFRLQPGMKDFERYLSYYELSGRKEETSLGDFLIDSNDELWIATLNGLYRTDKDKTKIKDYTGREYAARTILDYYLRITEDSNRNIWILNYNQGPFMFNRTNETFTKAKMPELSPGIGFTDLLVDRRSGIWVARYDRITLIDTHDKSARDFYLPLQGFDAQSYCLNSGMLLFIQGNRLFIFNYEIPLNRVIPPVYITGLSINNNELNTLFPGTDHVTDLKKVDLDFDQSNIRIEYAALNYDNPGFNSYRYFMSGVDKDTVEAGNIMVAEYRQMQPGKYKFWVTGSNNNDVWNKAGTSFEIHIHPPWYRSILAYIIYIIALISSIAGYVKYRTFSLAREKLRLEDEIKAHTAELKRKNLQLAETDRLKTDFFTGISHEIRTPLSLIIDPLETLLKKDDFDEKTTGLIEIMRRNAQRLMQLVTQLLDISRLDAGKMKISLSEGDLIKCLRIIIFEFLSLAESRHITYITELPEKEFVTLFDRDKIEKIASNLLSNAFKFTPQNGTVRCNIGIIPGEKENTGNFLKIKVTDTGPGITREHIDRIFERFYRVETLSETEGTGLGLALTRELIHLLHGEIKVISELDIGSEFIVNLPLGKEHLAEDEYIITRGEELITGKPVPQMAEQKIYAVPEQSSEGRMNLLIIEDNTDMRNYLQSSMSDDYNIMCAGNGRTGLNTALTMMPDIIVTDIMMPDIDGISLCAQLKNNELTSHIPVILLTAKSNVESKIEGLQSGADDYIIKPFNIEELKARLANLLALREKLRLKYGNLSRFVSGREKMRSIDDRFMQKVIQVIKDNITDFDFSVEILHEKIGISRMHLTRKLKILTGLTLGILIRNIRLEKAAELLLQKTGNITEIANSVGISNPSGFAKSFISYFGVSPKNYSKQ